MFAIGTRNPRSKRGLARVTAIVKLVDALVDHEAVMAMDHEAVLDLELLVNVGEFEELLKTSLPEPAALDFGCNELGHFAANCPNKNKKVAFVAT